jgi:hypothetical protein
MVDNQHIRVLSCASLLPSLAWRGGHTLTCCLFAVDPSVMELTAMIGNISIVPSKTLHKTQQLHVSSTPKPTTAFMPPSQFGTTQRHVKLVGDKLTVAVDSHLQATTGPGPMASPLRDRSNQHGEQHGKRTMLKPAISPIRVMTKPAEKKRGHIYAVVDTNQVVERRVCLLHWTRCCKH